MLGPLLLLALVHGPDVKTGLAYKTVDETPILMDLYLPEDPVKKPVPVVMMIHGGAWVSGERAHMAPLAVALADKGVAVANIDYRLAPKYKWPAMIEDCIAAERYIWKVKDDYGLDATRIGAIGGSAGGHLAMLMGFCDGWGPQSGPSMRVRAVVNLFGPTDLTQDFPAALANMVSMQVLGKKYEDAKEDARLFSPVTYIDAKSAPVYTLHGTLDTLVPVIQSVRLDEAMKKAERPHTRVVIEGMGHGVTAKDAELNKKIQEELDKALDWLVAELLK